MLDCLIDEVLADEECKDKGTRGIVDGIKENRKKDVNLLMDINKDPLSLIYEAMNTFLNPDDG